MIRHIQDVNDFIEKIKNDKILFVYQKDNQNRTIKYNKRFNFFVISSSNEQYYPNRYYSQETLMREIWAEKQAIDEGYFKQIKL